MLSSCVRISGIEEMKEGHCELAVIYKSVNEVLSEYFFVGILFHNKMLFFHKQIEVRTVFAESLMWSRQTISANFSELSDKLFIFCHANILIPMSCEVVPEIK